jgi:hypothetical protein
MHVTVVSTLVDLAAKLLGWAVFGWTLVLADRVDDFLGGTVMDRVRRRGRDGAVRAGHCPCRVRARCGVPAGHRARWRHAGRGAAR